MRLLLQLVDDDLAVVPQEPDLPLHRRARGGGVPRLRGRQDVAEALHEGLRLGWLADEGVGPEVQRESFILGVGVGGRVDDEGNRLELLVELPLPQQGVPVHHGHEQVGDQQVGRRLPGLGQRLGAVDGRLHLTSVRLQQGTQEVEDLGVVVDDEHFHGRSRNSFTSATKVSGSMGFSM